MSLVLGEGKRTFTDDVFYSISVWKCLVFKCPPGMYTTPLMLSNTVHGHGEGERDGGEQGIDIQE